MPSNRREFLSQSSYLLASMLAAVSRSARAEPAPEVRSVRLAHTPAICLAPQYLAEEILRAEGFETIEYVDMPSASVPEGLAAGRADISMWDVPGTIPALEQGLPVVMLAGVHAGCYELFGRDNVRAIRDLRGKRIAKYASTGGSHVLLSSILAYVGINPQKDVQWVTAPSSHEAVQLFIDGKADACIGFPPEPQELRAQKIGHVILNTAQDRPWSQYFCCCVNGNREFVRKNPIATKRVIRAILQAADLCASQPERVARYLRDKGFEARMDIGLDVLKGLPYRRWRESDPEDSLRFHALRLHEVGMIKTTPRKLIAAGTDWRFWNELKKELKA